MLDVVEQLQHISQMCTMHVVIPIYVNIEVTVTTDDHRTIIASHLNTDESSLKNVALTA